MFKYFNYLFAIIVFLTITACESVTKRPTVESAIYSIDSITMPEKDSMILQKIAKYREPLREEMDRVIAYSEHSMQRGTPQGLLNNFVADLVFNIGLEIYEPKDQKHIDFCLLNYGGLRTPIPHGEVTLGKVYELLPFENELVVVTLSPEKTYELFKYLAESEFGMPVSNIKLGIENNYPEVIEIDGKPYDDNRKYKVLTSDYLARGGDNMDFFLQPVNYELVGMMVRDAIIQHMKTKTAKGEKLSASLDERIFYLN